MVNEKEIREMLKNRNIQVKAVLDDFKKALLGGKASPKEMEGLAERCKEVGNASEPIVRMAVSALGIDRYNQINSEINREFPI